MQRNADKCAHCGEGFSRFTEKTPIVNRSDEKSFHVILFAEPTYHANQLICLFAYAHDRIGPKNHSLKS
ncbi:MAG: hypothetical protein WBC04_19475 [Candidatus Acidiferrales bacterium]